MLKRIFSIFAISLIITGLFFEGYSLECPVYADDTLDGWMNVTTNAQLVEAFRYYCKSRDLTIEGSLADGVTSFTTKTFNGLCNTLGYDLTALQAQVKYRTDSNLGLQYLFTTTGIDAYNQIFAQFLQDNELSVGDTNINKSVYNGMLFTDSDNISVLMYVTQPTVDVSNWVSTDINSVFSQIGSVYKYDNNYLISLYSQLNHTYEYTINNQPWTITTQNNSSTYNYMIAHGDYKNGSYQYNPTIEVKHKNGTQLRYSDIVICYVTKTNKIYLGSVTRYLDSGANYNKYAVYPIVDLTTSNVITEENTEPCTINIVSNTINNNTYEGDTIINNNGTTGDDDPPIDPPDPDPPTIPDDGGWQDFQLPSMPNDWLIYGMEKKFPFDIPFNIMFALSLLNHEPEIPKFEGDIDLKVCIWHYDIDLTPFDDIATILRRFEVLAFIIGLAILTKELIMWG